MIFVAFFRVVNNGPNNGFRTWATVLCAEGLSNSEQIGIGAPYSGLFAMEIIQCRPARRVIATTQPLTYLWLVGNGGMGYNYNYYYYHSSIPY